MSILAAPQGFKCGLWYRVRYAVTGEAVPRQFVGAFVGSVHTQVGWFAHFTLPNTPPGIVYPVHHAALMVCTPISDSDRDNATDQTGQIVLTRHLRAGRIGVIKPP